MATKKTVRLRPVAAEKRRASPRKPTIVKITLPVIAIEPLVDQIGDAELDTARTAARVDLTFVNDAADEVITLPVPRSMFRRLLDWAGR